MTDDDGRVLNAEFAVELDGSGLVVILESAGGTSSTGPSRNSDYIPALELILARLRMLGAVLVSGVVDSRKTGHLPESERTVLDRPLRLSVVDDLAALRLQLTSRQGRIGQTPNAPKAGNNRKRLRLRIEVPGYGSTDASRLATEIARPAAAPVSSGSATALPAQRRSGEPSSVRLNEWWQDDPAECYWLEITDRDDLGANVQALQRDGSGRENWSYALVTALRPGDIVLHWHKTQHQVPGIVGYSRAVDGPFDDELVWQARGTYGQSRPTNPMPQPSWRYELTGYTPLPTPVDQSAFQRAETALREIKRKLDEAYPAPLYYPFAFYESRPVRVMQAYMVKFPAAILDAVPELASIPRSRAPQPVRPTPQPRSSSRRKARSSGSGFIADPVLKVALERHAVERAAALYPDYEVADVGATRSYDLHAVKGAEEIHIEVKGSSGTAEKVQLTSGEVDHAHDAAATHLVVVDEIEWTRLPNGEIQTTGGRIRRWTSWTPHDDDLKATHYRYRLPGGGVELPDPLAGAQG
ncbi:protein NO VEIN domain-containing protein [Micromonospora saelicesensis]|uniref:protein NO VEIN domain-containing protein n=1 Tax=Micromonospora saelicesensis TaxID=285676 RepID=UPI003CE8AB17